MLALEVASILSRVKGPFNTNTLAQQMAITSSSRSRSHYKGN